MIKKESEQLEDVTLFRAFLWSERKENDACLVGGEWKIAATAKAVQG